VKRKNWIGKAKEDAGNEFFDFLRKSPKNNMATSQIWIFLKNFKNKGIFLSNSFDSLLSHTSRVVFTGSLARSVQKLWLIIFYTPKFGVGGT